MSEEIEWLDEELTNICQEVTDGVKEINDNRKMKPDTRIAKVDHLKERLARGKDLLQNFRVENRTVLKEIGKSTFDTYDAKGKEHNLNVTRLAQELDRANANAERRELRAGAKQTQHFDAQKETGNEIIEEGKRVQAHSAEALARAGKMVAEMEEMAQDTNVALRSQTEQIKNTHADVEGVSQGLKRADKMVKDIGRRLATDKMIMCMILMVILMILAVILVNSLGLVDGNSVEIDCSLNILKTNSQCREEEAAANSPSGGVTEETPQPTPQTPGSAPSATPTPSPDTNSTAQGNSTRRMQVFESSSPFIPNRAERIRQPKINARAAGSIKATLWSVVSTRGTAASKSEEATRAARVEKAGGESWLSKESEDKEVLHTGGFAAAAHSGNEALHTGGSTEAVHSDDEVLYTGGSTAAVHSDAREGQSCPPTCPLFMASRDSGLSRLSAGPESRGSSKEDSGGRESRSRRQGSRTTEASGQDELQVRRQQGLKKQALASSAVR